MGLADTIRETFGGGSAATHEGQSSEASRGVVDSHTPGAFPADTPIAEEQRELGGSQSNTAGSVLAGKEGVRGHEHKDSGVGLSDVTGGGHPKTVGQTEPLHSTTSTIGGNTNTSKLSDVTHSHPQTVDKSGLSHNTSAAANTPTSTGLSDVTQSRPQTVEKGSLHQSPLEQGTLQSHPRTAGHSDVTPTTGSHFRRSSVDMPKDSTSPGPSEGIDSHHKNDPSTLGGLLGGNYLGGASHKHEKSPLDKDSHLTGDTAGGLLSSEPYNRNTATQGTANRSPLGHDTSSTASTLGGTDASHNIVSNEKNKTNTGNKETYWGDLPTAESLPSSGIYNTVTGSGSGEDHSAQHRRVPAAGDSEVAMQSAGHGAEAHVRAAASTTPSGSGLYNALSGGYNVAANAAQGLYNTVSGRSASGTEHQYEHEKPLTTTTSTSNTAGTGSAALDPTGAKHQYEHESPFSSTTPSNRAVQSDTTPSSTGNNQGVAAGAYNTLASAAQGVSNTVTGNNNNNTTGTTGTQHERSAPLTGTSTTGSRNTTTGTNEPGVAEKTYDALASAAQGVSNTVTGNNNTHTTGNQYERDTPLTGATSRNTTTNTSGNQPGYAAGAYNAVANTAQSVSDTVTGNNRTTGYEQGGPYDSTSSSRSNLTGTTGTEHHQPGQLHTGNTTGTHRAFPLDNSSPAFTTTNRAAGSDLNPSATTTGTTGTTHDHHSHTGRNLAGAGVGAAAGAGAYDFLHRKENDKPDPQNEFVSNVNPYNAPQHEGWQHSDSPGLFSDSELKRLSLRQKEGGTDELSAPSHGESHNLSTSGPGQTHGFHGMSSHPTTSSSTSGPGYDTPESLTAAGSRSPQTRGDDFHGAGQTHGLGSGHPSAHKSEIPIPSRVHESPSSLAAQRAEPPHSSDHSNVGAGLAGAGVGAGAGYGASRLARDHHDDKHSGATSGIPTSTSSRQQQPVESSTLNRTAESPSSLAAQRAELPRSSDHSNVGAGLTGAGLGAGAGYGASRLARDHHDDKHSSTASGIPTSTSSHQQQPVESSTLNRSAEPTTSSHHKDHHKDDSSSGHHHTILPLPTRKHHDKNDRPDRSADDLGNTATSASGLHHDDTDSHQHGHHKARDVAALGAGAGAGAGAYEAVSHSRRDSEPKGVRQPGQSAANIGSSPPATMSSIAQERRTGHSPIGPTATTSTTTSPTSTLDTHQKERAAAGMTGISPSSNVGSGVAGAGVGAGAGAAAASGMNQQGLPQQQQDTLSRSGADGHAPLHSTIDEHVKERGTTVPSSAHAGKKDPYNHLSSGTPSGVSLE
ncbi:hypothetical protein PG993_002336 [Apiospora rasikravindrae]|uniref:Uncharacterized protein n=1 Tax=Apiospora rasikravindrae TaxID=990691 RepID=A0ABR1TWC7_9PEZI